MLNKIKILTNTQEIKNPCFIVGCGRSGTTILGSTLSLHSKITYLNEPRNLWHQAYPEADVWSRLAKKRKGKIFLNESNENKSKSIRLKRAFYKETLKTKKPFLVEKLPVNSFRLNFIEKIFPDAKYIHIYRNGLEVSRSIAKFCDESSWYGKNDFKWQELVSYSKKFKETASLGENCDTNLERGLLEWRLSTEAVVLFLKSIKENRYIELSYADFVEKPLAHIEELLNFMGLGQEIEIEHYLQQNLSRKTPEIANPSLSNKELLLGGNLLLKSIDANIHQLTSRL